MRKRWKMGRMSAVLVVNDDDRATLESWTRRLFRIGGIVFALAVGLLAARPDVSEAETAWRATSFAHGTRPSMSDDGRFVAYTALDVVSPGDTEARTQIYVKDTITGAKELVSVSLTGLALHPAYEPDISGDGRYVVFTTAGDGMVAGDHNLGTEIFLRDRQEGITTRVSSQADGKESYMSWGATISNDGRYVAHMKYTGFGEPQVAFTVVVDTSTGEEALVGIVTSGYDPIALTHRAEIAGDGKRHRVHL
jgi:Tol biopolymer transport system component